MKKQKNKSANKFDLEYFEDSTNFPNQIFLQDVFKYFENKNNQNTFELVEFLNLFKEQNDLLIENLSNPGKTFRNLKSLPVSGLDLHVLYFFILEFYGGYPLKEYQYYEYAESELNAANEEFARNYNTLLKLIETEFLSYPEDTAEKKTYLVKGSDGQFIKQIQNENQRVLKVPQIALICAYENIHITRENADNIASKHGYKAKKSGEGLYQDYLKYINANDRKAKPTAETKKTLKNKIKLFESVINHLSDTNKNRAIDEINILKTIFENEYQ